MLKEIIAELTPAKAKLYKQALNDYQQESLIALKRLRRKSNQWKGVSQAITIITNLKPE